MMSTNPMFLSIDSKIFNNLEMQFKLGQVVQKSPTPFTHMKLLYRGSRDGFTAAMFHKKCDQEENTFTVLMTTKGETFGGFSPNEWDH